jgi:diaminopimelate epimerase
MTRPFIKMHGLGNDFVIFDARKKPLSLSRAQAAAIADRRRGIGCDQVIVIEKAKKADAFMRIYNADGGEVSSCGNATRCVAWLLMEETGKKELPIQTKAGVIDCIRAGKYTITANMGAPKFGWRDIPLAKECDTLALPVSAGQYKYPVGVSMGNPHMVFVVPNANKAPLPILGPKLEKHPLFPKRANVSFAEPINKSKIKLRVWERGAGETLACGTAACATLAALHLKGYVEDAAAVELPGGTLDIKWDRKTGHIFMTGTVTVSFKGETEL